MKAYFAKSSNVANGGTDTTSAIVPHPELYSDEQVDLASEELKGPVAGGSHERINRLQTQAHATTPRTYMASWESRIVELLYGA
ncbi:hypothetical protein TgHK011_005919 [Trichoderma gracile]|nr:hypothetical protein TgHK011_005919 [Trichoderma gracile]